jgi:hypothetical protein
MRPPRRAAHRIPDTDNGWDAAVSSPPLPHRQPPPLEVHDPIATDKLIWFEVRVPTWLLRRLAEHFRRGPVREARP